MALGDTLNGRVALLTGASGGIGQALTNQAVSLDGGIYPR